MKGLDTNVIVRYLVEDDPHQVARAVAYIDTHCTADNPCRVNRIVLCELEWVLSSGYGYSRALVADVLERILRTGQFVIEDSDEAWSALRDFRGGNAEFVDCLLARTNLAQGCEVTATFDRKASRLDGFELLAAEPGEGS